MEVVNRNIMFNNFLIRVEKKKKKRRVVEIVDFEFIR